TIATENLEQLHQCLLEIATDKLASIDLRPSIPIDAEVSLASLQGKTFAMMQQLAPFGCANPYPTFISRDVTVVDYCTVGTDGEHLKLKLRDGDVTWDAIGFKLGNLVNEVTPHLDIVYNLEVDRWGGRETLQLHILDFAPAT
ncbi:MAG: single-stranded-DNA-specific exonuclease RecJ, partial [Chloroflexi bacterium]